MRVIDVDRYESMINWVEEQIDNDELADIAGGQENTYDSLSYKDALRIVLVSARSVLHNRPWDFTDEEVLKAIKRVVESMLLQV